MNLLLIKRMIRKNPKTRRFVDFCYALLTKQYIEYNKGSHKILNCKKNTGGGYYIIRPPYSAVGLLGLYLYVLGHMDYAIKKGYHPVVDFENYHTVYTGTTTQKNKNIWEWYFKQPEENQLKEAYQSGNYILARTAPRGEHLTVEIVKKNEACLQRYMKLAEKIHLQTMIEEHIDTIKEKLFPKQEKILGVFSRGTDYTQLKPGGHPVQPEPGQLVAMTKECLSQWGCSTIFLTTEEEATVKLFENEFPNKVITSKQKFISDYSIQDGMLIEEYKNKIYKDKYLSGLDYLTSVMLLSKCDCFLGAMANGSASALVFNKNQYQEKKIINLGFY